MGVGVGVGAGVGVGDGVGEDTVGVGVGVGVGEDTVGVGVIVIAGGAAVMVCATASATVLPARFAVNSTVDCFTICTGSGRDLNALV